MVADRAQWENEKERGKTDRHLGSMDEVQRVGKGVREEVDVIEGRVVSDGTTWVDTRDCTF